MHSASLIMSSEHAYPFLEADFKVLEMNHVDKLVSHTIMFLYEHRWEYDITAC